MKESLYDKYLDEHGFVDFGRSGGMSQQKEAKRFLSALNKQTELQQKDCFSISVCTKNSFCKFFSLLYSLNEISPFDDQKNVSLRNDCVRKYTAWRIELA